MPDLLNPFELDQPPEGGLRTFDRFQAGIATGGRGVSPVALELQEQDEQPQGFLGSVGEELSLISAAARSESILGAGGQRLIFAATDNAVVGDQIDPDFNVWDLVTPELVEQFPFVLDDARNGIVGDIPNGDAFQVYLTRRQEQVEDQERLAELGLLNRLFVSGVGQIPDLVTGGLLLRGTVAGAKALGFGAKVAQGVGFLSSATGRARLTRAATAGGVNAFQELGIQYADPFREVKPDQTVAAAALMGLAVGGAIEGAIAGGGRFQVRSSARAIERTMHELRQNFDVDKLNSFDDVLKNNQDALQEILDQPVTGPRTVNLYDAPQTNILAKAIQKKFDDAGEILTIAEHPANEFVQWSKAIESLDAEVSKGVTSLEKAIASGKIDEVSRAVADRVRQKLDVVTPGGKLKRTSSNIARRAHRLFFNETQPLSEAIDDPLFAVTPRAAENLKTIHRTELMEASIGIREALDTHLRSKQGPIDYVTASGENLRIASRFHRARFSKAVLDHMRRSDEVTRGQRPASDIANTPKAITDAADHVRNLNKRRANQLTQVRLMEVSELAAQEAQDIVAATTRSIDEIDTQINAAAAAKQQDKVASLLKRNQKNKIELAKQKQRVKDLEEAVKRQENHLTRRWRIEKVKADRPRFVQKLRDAFDQRRRIDHRTGAAIDSDSRLLLADVIENVKDLDVDGLTKSTGKSLDEITEAELRAFNAEFYDEYLRQVDAFRDRISDATTANMLDLKNSHGVEHDFAGANPLKSRVLEINETDFAEFLDDGLDQMMLIYDHRLSGRIAARRSIQLDADFWEGEVKRLLNEELTLDPEQILRAIRKDFQDKIDLVAAGGDTVAGLPKLQQQLIKDLDRTNAIFERKLDELQGMHTAPHDPALEVGFAHFAARNFLRFPAMAFLGKVTVSSTPDLANLLLYSQMTRQHTGVIVNALKEFAQGAILKKVPRNGLEGLAVALDEGLLRSMHLLEIADMPVSPNFGTGLKGTALAAAEDALDAVQRTFFRSTGMNRWNTVMKSASARLITWSVFDGARRMAKAADLVKAGVKQDDALRRVGLAKVDATRMNRLGINANNAGGIVDQFRRFGVDPDGKRLADLSDDAFGSHKRIVHPNFKDWDNPGLVETLTSAVNAEVDNIVVTPSLLSRPLFLNSPSFGFMGRAFHQFQSFAFAYGNQLAPMVAQRPTTGMANWMVAAISLGAVSDALHNQLSGRRSISESAELWTTNPQGMAYAAIDRAGLTGWLARPLGVGDQIGKGPGTLLGNDVSSAQVAQNLSAAGLIGGPFVDWLDLILQGGVGPALDPGLDFDARRQHTLRKGLMFQNHVLLSGIYQSTRAMGVDNPFGPGRGVDLYPLSTLPQNDLRRRRQPPQP